MKLKCAAVVSMLVVAVSAAASDYTISTSLARQDAILNQHRVILNTATCSSAGLPASCTQSQARAVRPGADIYSTVQDYMQRYHGPRIFSSAKAEIAASEAQAMCRWWNDVTTTRAAQDGICTSIGLSAGCELCN